jgi:aminoglycoside phosphotransferase (APT) family kinase protein
MARGDIYLQPGAKDPVLSPGTVLGIAAAHTGRASTVTEVDESGGEARAYLLDGGVVVKTQRPHRLRPRTSLAREARLLQHLAGPLEGLVPEMLGYGRTTAPEGDVEYLVISRMPGRAARHVRVTGAEREELLREAGRLLARLHAVPSAPLLAMDGLFPADRDGAALRSRLEIRLADVLDVIAERPGCWTVVVPPEHAAAQALDLLPARFTPVVLHSNPGPTHVFCDPAGALTGVIDFGDSFVSHPALDLRAWPDPADRLALRAGYLDGAAPDSDFDAAWTAAMIWADMAALAGNPDLAEAAAADLAVRLAG